MKKIVQPFLLVLIALAACSCKKDNTVAQEDFYFQARKNNTAWVANANSYYTPGEDTLRIQAFKTDSEQQIFLALKFNGKGTYPLKGSRSGFLTTIGQDAVTSQYRLNEKKANALIITDYNSSTQVITGRFELNLVRDDYTNALTPLVFSKGSFRLKLPDRTDK